MSNKGIIFPNSLRKKLYQLVVSRLDGDAILSMSYQENTFRLIEEGIGGFIIFGGKKDEIKHFIDNMQTASEIPLFIASDVEQGVGQQIQGYTLLPSQMAVAAAIKKNVQEDITLLREAIQVLADEATDTGINMPLIPVVDVNKNPDNPIICTRAFSDDPEDVSWFGSEYIQTLENSGLISCAKHFPGHGDTSTDSHFALPVINKSYNELMNIDIVPFKKAISTGVSSIMIGHLSIPAIDQMPASLSKTVITTFLRDELRFDGLILTDALTMHALRGFGNIYTQSIKAGVDILLHPADPDRTVEELILAIKSKEIAEDRVDKAVHRILIIKKRLRYKKLSAIDYKSHAILSRNITDMSISLYKNSPGLLPINDCEKVDLIFAGNDTFFESSPFKKLFKKVSVIDDNIELQDSILLCILFTTIAAWKGSPGIHEDEKKLINELIKKAKKSIVVSFGSPYILRHFRNADILIAAYDVTEQTQSAVMACLRGHMDFKGRLPVTLE